MDRAMLKYVRAALQGRLVACEDAAAGKEDYHTDEARMAISHEALWLSALWTQVNQYMETGAVPFEKTDSSRIGSQR